ncbi:MAG: hypothetical protein AAF357_07320 [Verrucomicrobiota bacterium]
MRVIKPFFYVGLVSFFLSSCEQPQLRTGPPPEQPEEEMPIAEAAELASVPEEPTPPTVAAPPPASAAPEQPVGPRTPEPGVPGTSSLTDEQRRVQILQREQMIEAQLAGVRSIEGDIARHNASLISLRSQLQGIRTKQAYQGGGVRVERINGESTLVNRAAEAKQIEAKIKAEEQLVAQFNQALTQARQRLSQLQTELTALQQP